MKDHEDQPLYSTTFSSRCLKRCLTYHNMIRYSEVKCDFATQDCLYWCFSTAGPRPGTGPWHQLYRAARGFRKLEYATRFH